MSNSNNNNLTTQNLNILLESSSKAKFEAQIAKGIEAYFEAYYKGTAYTTALAELTPPADNGYAKAQYYLGEMYYWGQGVVKNERTAVEWYQKAADQGYAGAQYSLGVM